MSGLRACRDFFCNSAFGLGAIALGDLMSRDAIAAQPAASNPLVAGSVFGISEWQNYYRGDEPGINTPKIIDECVEAHLAVGIDGIVWNAGRATILYHSELPHTTRQYELGFAPKLQRVSCQYVLDVLKQCCPLRRAIELGHANGIPILGRLSMNRFYGAPNTIDSTSRFYQAHPGWVEVGKLGQPIRDRMCYAIPGVQQERLDILLEIQRIGVDALVLDYCRQMPILWYHPAIVQPHHQKTRIDPRSIDTTKPEDYTEWFQYRADILTSFMRKLRAEVRKQEEQLGRPCPIVARVPDYAPWLMVACGLDIETWFAEDLIDATMLSPFPRLRDDMRSYPEYHAGAAHRHGKLCIGGVGSKGLQKPGQMDLPDARVEYACQVADRQYKGGVDAMSLYQSESLCRKDYLKEMVRRLGDKEWIARAADGLEDPQPDDERYYIGKDWHSRPENEGLGTEICGNFAL